MLFFKIVNVVNVSSQNTNSLNKKIEIIVLTLVSFLVGACSVYKYETKKINGIYKDVLQPCTYLKFTNDEFYFVNICDSYNHTATYVCCDTLAYGKYSHINNLIEISSTRDVYRNILNFEIIEKEIKSNGDSISFEFHNPITDEFDVAKSVFCCENTPVS